MSLKTRLAKLEARMGTRQVIESVMIYYGPHILQHTIEPPVGGMVTMHVPCPRGADPRAHLSPEQAELIGLAPTTAVAAANNPRDRDRDNRRYRPEVVCIEAGSRPRLRVENPP
ncbi:MAG TPA: hypothetical protein VFF52_12020 [Isosphaeraceae bacterium]|nr:hypothetical protein [Isosphaeraceae bacterium]